MSGLAIDNYSFKNAVLWGNCQQHLDKAKQGGKNWFGHAVVAIVEMPPLVSQIVSIIEWVLAKIAALFTQKFPSQIDNGAALKSLKDKIADFKQSIHDVAKKKGALLELGLDRLLKVQPSGPRKIEMTTLADPTNYVLTENSSPQYFSRVWNAKPLNVTIHSRYYNYEQVNDKYAVDVDFANRYLGGGWHEDGFVQEEILAFEMPEFANLLTQKGYFTRVQNPGKTGPGVLEGSPTPILMKDLLRVQAVDNDKAYGRKIFEISQKELLNSTLPVNPQKVNLLAIAAPKLPDTTPAIQFNKTTLKDLYNSLMAGMEVAQEEAQAVNLPLLFRSGKLGCGVFHNNVHAGYLLHCLLLSDTGVEGGLYGYSPSEQAVYGESWKKVSAKMVGKTLDECMEILSAHLTNPQKDNIMTQLFKNIMSLIWKS